MATLVFVGLWIAIAVLVVVVAAIVVAVMKRRPGTPLPSETPPTEPPATAPREAVEMTGLESALAAVTDSSGTRIADRIDAEAAHVDELRVPDDTGPLLRRALDHVAPADDVADTEPDTDDT